MDPTTNTVRQYFASMYHAAYSIFEGMAVTLSYLGRKPTTIQWPDWMEDKRPLEEQLPARYRGILEVDMGLCNGCLSCQRDCPIGCIDIKVVTDAATKERRMTRFAIDIAKCMYCALCTEHCPNDAIRHTTEFAHSTPDMNDLVLEFVDAPVTLKKVVKGEAPVPFIKKPGDRVRALLAKKGYRRGPKQVPAPVADGFSARIPYAGQPDVEELHKKAQAFAEHNYPKPKPTPTVEPKGEAPKANEPKGE